jgi:hypothetical protein
MAVDDEDKEWLLAKLKEHVVSGAIEEATCLDFMAAAFIVRSGAEGKRRLVIDLKDLNMASEVAGIRFEGIPHLRHLMRPGDHMFSIDLESAFHHVPLAASHRRYFAFSIAGMAFQFAALPFGWSASPLIFTKVLRPFTKFLRCGGEPNEVLATPARTETAHSAGDYALPPLLPRQPPRTAETEAQAAEAEARRRASPSFVEERPKPPAPGEFVSDPGEAAELTASPENFAASRRGLRCLLYLDDLIVMSSTKEGALAAASMVRAAVEASGLSVNNAKCHWEPTQRLVHLGIEIDTVAGSFKVPQRRATALRATAHELLKHQAAHKRWVPARLLARLLGLAAASYVAVPTARLLSRASHDVLGSLPCDSAGKRRLWHSSVRLDRPALADIRAWADFTYAHPTNGRPIWAPSSTTRTLHTDASKFPWDLLPHVLRKLRVEGASATVVAPLWRSATWWPDLMELSRDMVVFDPSRDAFLPGHLGSDTPLGNPKWQFVAADLGPRPPASGLQR